jgi:hypothetical protein
MVEVRQALRFAVDRELTQCVLTVCSAVLWFESYLPSVSAVLASLVHELHLELPLWDFIDLMCAHIGQIEKFSFLFAELQQFGVFSYDQFLRVIVQHGDLHARREESARLVLNLPCVSRIDRILRRLCVHLGRACPGHPFDEQLDAVISNFDGNVEVAQGLPFVIKYQYAQWIADEGERFAEVAHRLVLLWIPSLIVRLVQRFKSCEIPIGLVAVIESILPVFAAHNELANLAALLLGRVQFSTQFELVVVLHTHYRHFSVLAPSKAAIAEIVKANKVPAVDRKAVGQFARDYSHFFSLHTLDAFLDVRTSQNLSVIFPLFFRDILAFGFLDVDSFMELFKAFSESSCILKASHFFIKTFLGVLLANPDSLQQDCQIELIAGILETAFLNRMVSAAVFLHAILTGSKKARNRAPESLNVVRLLLDIFCSFLGRFPDLFNVNDILTENTVRGFAQTFQGDPQPLTNLLTVLREYPSPVITREIQKIADSASATGSAYLAALFSLLPETLHSLDFVDAFEFFTANVGRTTSTFWMIWLELKQFYVPGFPVVATTPEKEVLANYRGILISAFSTLLFRANPGDERTLVFLNCWTLLCNNPAFAHAIADNLIDDLRLSRLSLFPLLLDFLHPCLLSVADRTFDAIADGLCRFVFEEPQFEAFARLAASVFMVYVWRFPGEQTFVPAIADKLLEWIPQLYEICSRDFEYIIDCFNFIFAHTHTDRDEDGFQDLLHRRVIDRVKALPKEIREHLILLNRPQRMFEPVKEPLYADYTEPDRDQGPPFAMGHTFSPDRNEPAFTAPFENTTSLFNPFDDDLQSWHW